MIILRRKKTILFYIFVFLYAAFAESYTAKKGDTLYSIAKRYEITLAELRTANNLSESDVLKAGQTLVIPTADIENAAALAGEKKPSDSKTQAMKTENYTVKKGDTLYSIAKRNGIKLYDLLAVNNLKNDAVIKTGQILKLIAKTEKTTNPVKASSSKNATPTKNAHEKDIPQRIGDSSLLWPLENPRVVYTNGKVSGVELSSKKNETVKAIRSGTVMYTGMYRGYGNIVFIESKTGLIYAYAWLTSIAVQKGDYVVSGDALGKTGEGDEKSKRLTFMVFQNGKPLDPAKAPRG